MIISRVLAMFFRFAEFVCSTVVLGIVSYFLHQWRKNKASDNGPHKREIYAVIVAAISTLLSLVWLLPFTYNLLHYPLDLIMAAAWFAVFGLLVDWIGDIDCGTAFHWGGLQHGGMCNRWRAAEAFSFIAACFWLASALLGMWVYHKLRKQHPVATDGTTTTKSRSRFGRKNQSAV